MTRIDELAGWISQARNAYYNHQSSIPDAVYDAWIDELTGLDPKHPAVTAVGAPADDSSEWKKAQHQIPMNSLSKVNTDAEFRSWVAKSRSKVFFVAEKMDGLSIELIYEKGVLKDGITRGDGFIGESILSNVRKMKGVLGKLPMPVTGSFRGEIILRKSDHTKHFPDYANPRNAAGGISKRLDGEGNEHLSVYVYQSIIEGYDFKTQDEQATFARDMGFTVPNVSVGDVEHCTKVYRDYEDSVRASLDYEIDGLVVSCNSLDELMALGEKDHRPYGQLAWKFSAEYRETTVKEIFWSVGKTGRITPVAIIEPTKLMGTTIENVSLHNIGNMRALGVDVGCKALIKRAGDVIPFLEEVTQSTGTVAKPPSHCPVCSAPVVSDGEYLLCRNNSCKALQVGRLQMWVNELGILEWGESVLTKLSESGKVKSIADLYRLSEADISSLDRMGEKSAKKLRQILWAAAPIALETILGGLSIPNCQTTTSRLVVHTGGFDTVDKLLAVTEADLTKIQGLGPVKAASVVAGIRENAALIKEIASLAGLKQKVVGTLTGKSFCFTGAMTSPRKVLEQKVKDRGGLVHSSVGRGLTYLVIADPNSTSSKAEAARKLGTKCISEGEFLAMV